MDKQLKEINEINNFNYDCLNKLQHIDRLVGEEIIKDIFKSTEIYKYPNYATKRKGRN